MEAATLKTDKEDLEREVSDHRDRATNEKANADGLRVEVEVCRSALTRSKSDCESEVNELRTKLCEVRVEKESLLKRALERDRANGDVIRTMKHKLVEVESYLSSSEGRNYSKLEGRLAETKLRLVMALSERDEMEMMLREREGTGTDGVRSEWGSECDFGGEEMGDKENQTGGGGGKTFAVYGYENKNERWGKGLSESNR